MVNIVWFFSPRKNKVNIARFISSRMYDYDVCVCPNCGYQTFVAKIVTPISYCSNCQISSSEQIYDVSVRNMGLNTKELLLTLVQDYTWRLEDTERFEARFLCPRTLQVLFVVFSHGQFVHALSCYFYYSWFYHICHKFVSIVLVWYFRFWSSINAFRHSSQDSFLRLQTLT